jgi:hypothetical protein
MSHRESHERSEYRIVYPLSVRPSLMVGEQRFAVVDVSEHGARLIDTATAERPLGEHLTGTLVLTHGPVVAIRGVIVRRFADGFALAFDEDAHIILPRIIAEQRHLRAQFPDWR